MAAKKLSHTVGILFVDADSTNFNAAKGRSATCRENRQLLLLISINNRRLTQNRDVQRRIFQTGLTVKVTY